MKPNEKGFSLLEVIIAIFILGMIALQLTLVPKLTSNTFQQNVGQELAERKLETYHSMKYAEMSTGVTPDTAQVVTNGDNTTYTYRITVTEYNVDNITYGTGNTNDSSNLLNTTVDTSKPCVKRVNVQVFINGVTGTLVAQRDALFPKP